MSTQVKMNDISVTNVGEVVRILSSSYSKLINNKRPLKSFPSVMLWSSPGVGKSQGVRQIAENIEKQTGKKVNVTDVRLLLFNPIDLRGIPSANADKTLAIWLKPKIFDMDPSEDVVNILFLDEISAAPTSVQAAAYQITLDRVVGEHKLPENCIVIAAGNRVTDKSVAYKMPKALSNRLLHFEIESDIVSWRKWAITHNIHPMVLGFLSFQEKYLNTFNASNDSLAFATPRSYEMVSNILNNIDDDIDNVYPLISGLIGSGIAIEFRTWAKIYSSLPKLSDIYEGKKPIIPTNPSALFALSSNLIDFVRSKRCTDEYLSNVLNYIIDFPKDYSIMLIEDFMEISNDFKLRMIKDPSFSRWLVINAPLLNKTFKE